MFEHAVLLSIGTGKPDGYHDDIDQARAGAQQYSATVTSLIVVVAEHDDQVILAAYERGEEIPLAKARLVAKGGYTALKEWTPFAVTSWEQPDHDRGDPDCGGCWQGWPRPCGEDGCKGLVHGAFEDESNDDVILQFECDWCGSRDGDTADGSQ